MAELEGLARAAPELTQEQVMSFQRQHRAMLEQEGLLLAMLQVPRQPQTQVELAFADGPAHLNIVVRNRGAWRVQ